MKLKRVAANLLAGMFVAAAFSSCATTVSPDPTPAVNDKNPVVIVEEEFPAPPVSAVYLVAPVAAGG